MFVVTDTANQATRISHLHPSQVERLEVFVHYPLSISISVWNTVLPISLQSVYYLFTDKVRDKVMINSAKEVKGQIFAFRQEKKKHKCVLELHFNTSLRNKIRRVKSCCHCSDIVRSQADLTNNRTKQTICCFLSEGRACYSVNTHDSSACVCVCVCGHKNSTQLLWQNSAHSAQWLKMLQPYFWCSGWITDFPDKPTRKYLMFSMFPGKHSAF